MSGILSLSGCLLLREPGYATSSAMKVL